VAQDASLVEEFDLRPRPASAARADLPRALTGSLRVVAGRPADDLSAARFEHDGATALAVRSREASAACYAPVASTLSDHQNWSHVKGQGGQRLLLASAFSSPLPSASRGGTLAANAS
jgi:hypothetical protein